MEGTKAPEWVVEDHPREKARLDSVWTADYQPLGAASIVIGDAAMEAYGGSSTPTRLTEQELEKAIALALR